MLKFAILGIAVVAIALAVTVYVDDPKPIPPSPHVAETERADPKPIPPSPHVAETERAEPCDIFPIKSSDTADSTLWTGDPPPEICMSRLPNIGETAVVEITFTNAVWGHVTDTERYRNGFFETGWGVDSEFEIVDSGGLKYETICRYGTSEISNYGYTEFTPLNAGESKTYRIEVRAVEEGRSYVSAYGYGEEASIGMYLDDEETMHLQDHMALYPEMYEITPRALSDEEPEPPLPGTEEPECPQVETGSR